MELEGMSSVISNAFVVKDKVRRGLCKHFSVIKIINAIAAILFVIMGIFLVVAFALNSSITMELQQAANFDNWKFFYLASAAVAFIAAAILGFGVWKVLLLLVLFLLFLFDLSFIFT